MTPRAVVAHFLARSNLALGRPVVVDALVAAMEVIHSGDEREVPEPAR